MHVKTSRGYLCPLRGWLTVSGLTGIVRLLMLFQHCYSHEEHAPWQVITQIWLNCEHRLSFVKGGKPFLNVETTEGYPSCLQINADNSIGVQTSKGVSL